MRGSKFINAVLAAFTCIGLIISTILIIILIHHSNKSDSIELNSWHKSHCEPFHLTNLLPGDSDTQYFVIKVYHYESTTLYFQVDETKKSGTFDLSKKLFVDIVLIKSGTTLFSGTMAELTQHAVALDLPKNNKDYTTVQYAVRVYLHSDVGNDYQFTGFHGDFKWWVNEGASFAPFICILLVIIILVILITAFLLWATVTKKKSECDNFWPVINLLMIIFLILLLIITLCLFLRTSYIVPGNIFQTGGVAIKLNDGEKLFDNSCIVPGETIKKEVTIKNLGTSSVYYRLYLKNVSGSLKDDLVFNFYYHDTLVKSVHPAKFTVDNSLSSNVKLNVDSDVSYTLEVLLPEQIGNADQGEFLDFDIVVDAVQAKNNPR